MKKSDVSRKTLNDRMIHVALFLITLLCSFMIVFIIVFISIRGLSPFISNYTIKGNSYKVNLGTFLVGNTWFQSPNIYGAGFIVLNTIYVTALALLLAVPVSVLSALLISKMVPRRIGKLLTTIYELLASIPSVIYGLFGLVIITRVVKNLSDFFGYQSAGGISTLSTIIVLAIMIIPTITMVSITAMDAVKPNIIQGSLALGATPTQTNFKIVLKSAQSGIFSGIILAVGRALGEATAVSLVAGNAGTGPTFNLFDTTRTLTSTMLLGLKETSGLDYDIRFSVGILLILLILGVNIILNAIKRRMLK